MTIYLKACEKKCPKCSVSYRRPVFLLLLTAFSTSHSKEINFNYIIKRLTSTLVNSRACITSPGGWGGANDLRIISTAEETEKGRGWRTPRTSKSKLESQRITTIRYQSQTLKAATAWTMARVSRRRLMSDPNNEARYVLQTSFSTWPKSPPPPFYA